MSEKKPQEPTEQATEKDSKTSEDQRAQEIEVVIDKATNEFTFRDPASGRVYILQPKVLESEEEDNEEEQKPLSPEEFREALYKLDALGLTWTADLAPEVKAKGPEFESALYSEEFREIQKRYPQLPRELYVTTSYFLTGNKTHATVVGNEEYLQAKVATARDLFVNTEFRSEFFFKHAIKVPYLQDIDWEVIFKLGEKNVQGMPGVSYGLLSLSLRNPFPRDRAERHLTVAVDHNLVKKLIGILNELETKLEKAKTVTDKLGERFQLEDESNGSSSPKQLG